MKCLCIGTELEFGVLVGKTLVARTRTNNKPESTRKWRRVREWHPGHIGGKWLLSPLRRPYSQLRYIKILTLQVTASHRMSRICTCGDTYHPGGQLAFLNLNDLKKCYIYYMSGNSRLEFISDFVADSAVRKQNKFLSYFTYLSLECIYTRSHACPHNISNGILG